MYKKALRFLILLLMIMIIFTVNVNASAPYVTNTLNRYDEVVETQTAYEPVKSVKTINANGTIRNIINGAQDLFIDKDDTLYIANTKDKEILILDRNFNYINSFGSDVLNEPLGIFVRDEYIYVADFGVEDDKESGKIAVFKYDKVANTVTLDKTYKSPSSRLLEVDNFIYRPEKIAVDKNHTMYVVCKGSSNGILLINSENRFLNYFAPNQTTGTLWDLVKNYLYGMNEKVILTKKIPPAPTNVMLDDSGYIYTVTKAVTKNSIGDTLKKVNIGGINMYPAEMHASSSFVDSYASNYKTIYSVTSNGFIYEYDIEGNLLFIFGGNVSTDEQLGLFKAASSIAVDSSNNLYIVDPNANSIQVFRKTEFATKVHDALVLYMSGKYSESKEYFEEVLRYNSMFDLAHKGIGLAHYLEGSYKEAMDKFVIANAKEEYSDAFWQVRNDWIMANLGIVIGIVICLIVVIVVLKKLHRKYGIFDKVSENIEKFKKLRFVDGLLVMTKFIRHPLDAVYEIRKNKNVTYLHGIVWLLILFALYIFNITCTGFLFNNVIIERIVLIDEIIKIIVPIILFIVANYLISSLMSGSGTFKSIFLGSIGSLTPIILMLPFIIVVSNVLTYNEQFIYTFSLFVMWLWTVVLLFVVIKETHGFSAKQNFVCIFITIIMILIIIIVLILVYLVMAHLYGFIVDIFKEAMF